MAEQESLQLQEFRIGLLVVAGFVAVVLLILVSDRITFDSYYRVTAYMENAAGLQTGSPVELTGIQIGEIDSIQTSKSETAPGAVIAVLRINDRYTLYSTSTLTVASSGIFGDSFLSFSTQTPEDDKLLAKDGTAIVVAAPGFIDEVRGKGEQIINSVADLLDDDMRANVKRLVSEGADAASETKKLVATLNKSTIHVEQTLNNLDKASASIQKHAEEVGKRSQAVLDNVDGGVTDLRKQLTNISGELEGIAKRLESSLASVDGMSRTANEIMLTSKDDIITALDKISAIAGQLESVSIDLAAGKGPLGKLLKSDALSKDIDKIAIDLQSMAERISDHPEILVFGDSEEDRAKARMARKKREQRRAFNEGYGSVLGSKRPRHDEAAEANAVENKTTALPAASAEDSKALPTAVIENSEASDN